MPILRPLKNALLSNLSKCFAAVLTRRGKDSSDGIHPTGGYPIVNFTFNLKCAKIFGELTSKNLGKRFAVVLDDEIITAPRINGAITGGSGFIEGSFTQQSAKELSLLLNAGALPAKLIIAEERTVSAELGLVWRWMLMF